MPDSEIPNDVVISDILHTLDRPEQYVRRVFGNMVEYRKEHGTAVVRIGRTGRGIAPHYRVQVEHSAIGEVAGHFNDDPSEYFMAFHGRSHQQLEWGARELRTEHWSSRAMIYDDVQALLGKLRGFKARKSE
jgi:hypothetical protein